MTNVQGVGNDPEYRRSAASDDDTDALISKAIELAVQYAEELAPERVTATEYYHGHPFGNEEDGRSRVVLTEVRDGILGAIPSIMRVVHGPEHVVEYVPRRADSVAAAEQATDYARFLYEDDNGGFFLTRAVLHDGLLKRIGILKWGMTETEETTTTMYRGVVREELEPLLMGDESANVTGGTDHGDGTFDVEISHTAPVGRVWIMAVPPDDFFWNRDARSLDEATLCGNRARLTRGELVGMGISESDIDEYGGNEVQDTLEEQARRLSASPSYGSDQLGEVNRRILYCEAYMMLAGRKQGTSELRRICTLGAGYHVIKNEPAHRKPFSIFTPLPEPHAMLGGSYFHLLGDTQLINSQLFRGFFDSLSVSLFPRPVYKDGAVSVADIMNNAIGAPIRVRDVADIRYDAVPFTGEKVIPAMGMIREVIERRIGQKDGAGSLDMDALQSTGKEAVEAAIVAAQAQVEMLARIFSEQTLKPLFRGILELVAHPSSKERLVRLRGEYVPVRPASWDAGMDVSVTVALGSMNTDRKIGLLKQVVEDQSNILKEFGLENPAVSLDMLFNTKNKILRLSGIKDTETYYKVVPKGWQPPPPPPPEPTEDEKWREHEAQRAQEKALKELAIKQDELALALRKHQDEMEFKMRELTMREEEAAGKLTVGPHNAKIERYKADLDDDYRRMDIASRETLERERLVLAREKMYLEAEVKRDAVTKQSEAAEKATVSAEKASDKRAAAPSIVMSQPELGELAKAVAELRKVAPPVVNVPAPVVNIPAPIVNVPAPIVNVAAPAPVKKGKRQGKVTGPDGKVFMIETSGDE